FEKWRQRWSTDDVREVIEEARKLPAMRPAAHEAELQRQALQRADNAKRWEIENMKQELEGAKQQLRELDHRFEDLQAKYDTVVGSRSWRITRPLRAANAAANDMRRAFQINRLRLQNATS